MLLLTPGIAPVKFVRVGKGRYVFLSHRSGVLLEVRVIDSINGIDTLSPVEHQQLAKQIKSFWAELAKSL